MEYVHNVKLLLSEQPCNTCTYKKFGMILLHKLEGIRASIYLPLARPNETPATQASIYHTCQVMRRR